MSRHVPTIIPISDRDQWLELRKNTIGASESAALLESVTEESSAEEEDDDLEYSENGEPASPYLSPLSLWALKTGRIETVSSPGNRISWGTRLEPIIAAGIAEKEGWTIHKPEGYYLHPVIPRMGCSLDFNVETDDSGEKYPLEIKNVADTERWKWRNALNEWMIPGHIQIQVQHQMSVTGAEKAYVGVLFGGSEERVFEVDRNQAMIDELEASVVDFIWHIDNDVQPTPNLECDSWIIKRLYAHCDPNHVIDWSEDEAAKILVVNMKNHQSLATQNKKEADRLRDALILKLGDAVAATLGDGVLTAKTVEGGDVAYHRDPYRVLRVGKTRNKHGGRPIGQILDDQSET